MKQKFTQQKSANRHPKKYNFSEIETMPVWMRRMRGFFTFDSEKHDAELKERAEKAAARANKE